MSDERNPHDDDPAVVGVPPETPTAVRPSATGVVTGPLDTETDVEVSDVRFEPEEQATVDAGGEHVGTTEEHEPEIEGPNSE